MILFLQCWCTFVDSIADNNHMRESLSERILLLLVGLVTSQQRKQSRLRNLSSGRSIHVETQIVIAVRGHKVEEIQALVNTDARFHRLVTCLQIDQITDLHRADVGNASHIFVLGGSRTTDVGQRDSLPCSRLPNVTDLRTPKVNKHDMRLATWALQAQHVLQQKRHRSHSMRELEDDDDEDVDPTAGLTTQTLVQLRNLESKKYVAALPHWHWGRDHCVFTEHLTVALMAKAVLWPGMNHLLETWVLPVEAFGPAFCRRSRAACKELQATADFPARCPDDFDRWGWLDEYSRGLSNILCSAPLPYAAMDHSMADVAASLIVRIE